MIVLKMVKKVLKMVLKYIKKDLVHIEIKELEIIAIKLLTL